MPVLLSLVYAIVVIPVSVIRKLRGDPLDRRWDERAPTYWTVPHHHRNGVRT